MGPVKSCFCQPDVPILYLNVFIILPQCDISLPLTITQKRIYTYNALFPGCRGLFPSTYRYHCPCLAADGPRDQPCGRPRYLYQSVLSSPSPDWDIPHVPPSNVQ